MITTSAASVWGLHAPTTLGGPHAPSRVTGRAPASVPYFRNDLRIARLVEAASAWRGTPWCANSEAIGPRGGVACHNLPRALYIACGALPDTFPRMIGDPVSTRRARGSVMADFLDSRPEFSRVGRGSPSPPLADLLPGDLLGLRIYRHVDHLGVLLNNGPCGTHFVHVLMHKLTTFDDLSDPTWSSRVLAAWRIIKC